MDVGCRHAVGIVVVPRQMVDGYPRRYRLEHARHRTRHAGGYRIAKRYPVAAQLVKACGHVREHEASKSVPATCFRTKRRTTLSQDLSPFKSRSWTYTSYYKINSKRVQFYNRQFAIPYICQTGQRRNRLVQSHNAAYDPSDEPSADCPSAFSLTRSLANVIAQRTPQLVDKTLHSRRDPGTRAFRSRNVAQVRTPMLGSRTISSLSQPMAARSGFAHFPIHGYMPA